MTLWILKKRDDLPMKWGERLNPWEPWYDTCCAMVVRADNEERARAIAAESHKQEIPDAWLTDKWSTCEELTANGEEDVLIQDVSWA